MKLLQAIFLTILVGCAVAQYAAPKPPTRKVPEVDQTCMECICQASSNCDTTLKCHNAGGGAYFCGPYVISWAYWHDGGRPGDRGKAHDFETCLSNKTCAEKAVRGYMRKYGQDCDRTGTIDCFDFARIHKLGYGQCSSDNILDTDYWEKFEICYVGYNGNDPNNYDQNDNVNNYGQNDNVNNYGQNDNANNYGQNDNANNYGQNEDPHNYGQGENDNGQYNDGAGQLQARRVHN